MEKYKDYLLWKRKNILKIVNGEVEEFIYDVNKKNDEIIKFLGEEISIEKLKIFEKTAEEAEKKFYYLNEKDIITEFEIFLEEIKKETKEEYQNIKREIKEYFENNLEYSDLEFNEEIIKQFIFEEKILEKNQKKIVDIYQIPIKYRGEIFEIDYKNKLIKRSKHNENK